MLLKNKPLGQKAYGHIPHLPESKLGIGEHTISERQAEILTKKIRDKFDKVFVTEKLDGSCCAVAKLNGELVPLGKAGYTALSSPFILHHYFHYWVINNKERFNRVLNEGERIIGEWLAVAHGTKYDLSNKEPFIVFDLMKDNERLTQEELTNREIPYLFNTPPLLSNRPIGIEEALNLLGIHGHYGAIDLAEGCVWRIERKGKVDFLAKFVRHEKVPGLYFPEKKDNAKLIYNYDCSNLIPNGI